MKKNKETSAYRKLEGEALQGLLALRRRGGKIKSKKGKGSFKRQKGVNIDE